MPASTQARVAALMRAASREPSWERTLREMVIVLWGKRCVWREAVRAEEIVDWSSRMRLFSC